GAKTSLDAAGRVSLTRLFEPSGAQRPKNRPGRAQGSIFAHSLLMGSFPRRGVRKKPGKLVISGAGSCMGPRTKGGRRMYRKWLALSVTALTALLLLPGLASAQGWYGGRWGGVNWSPGYGFSYSGPYSGYYGSPYYSGYYGSGYYGSGYYGYYGRPNYWGGYYGPRYSSWGYYPRSYYYSSYSPMYSAAPSYYSDGYYSAGPSYYSGGYYGSG